LGARIFLAVRNRRALTWTTVFLAAFFTAFAYLLLLLYIAVFPQHKAEQVASYIRYINTVVLPVVMVALAWYLPLGNRFGWRTDRRHVGVAVVALCLACLYLVEKPYLKQISGPPSVPQIRQRVSNMTGRVTRSIPDDARVYVISLVRDNGFFEVLLRYQFSPVRTTFGMPKSIREFRGQDYVWVFALDEKSLSRLGKMFTPGYRLFEVYHSEGQLELSPVI
jgi:hypothetical protein